MLTLFQNYNANKNLINVVSEIFWELLEIQNPGSQQRLTALRSNWQLEIAGYVLAFCFFIGS